VSSRQTVHIEQGICSHRELHPVGTGKCTLPGGESKKEKALISQDFFGLVVATGLEFQIFMKFRSLTQHNVL